MVRRFRDRTAAGKVLAGALLRAPTAFVDPLVLALPRGGVPVALEVASALGAPLDVFIVVKLGAPGQEELAMGAVAMNGVRVLNEDVVAALKVPDSAIAASANEANREIERRQALYRGKRPFPSIAGRSVVIVDDGLATGSSMSAAVLALKAQGPADVTVAVPVGAADSLNRLWNLVDRIVCPVKADRLYSVGMWYEDFSQVDDETVRRMLGSSRPLSRSASF